MAYIIKVEYEGSLRRFLASRAAEENDLSLAKLEARMRNIFNIPSTAQLQMTYKDKENNEITLGNDQNLTDACITQKINPLYIRLALVTKAAAGKKNFPVTAEAEKVSPTPDQEPVKESNSTPEKSKRKTIKVVDPIFQRILPPNQVPRMMENIAKMMTPQMPVEKKVEASPSSSQPKSDEPTTVHQSNVNSTKEKEKQTEEKARSNDPAIRKGVGCNMCQMNPIVGPRFQSVKTLNTNICGSCYNKAGNPKDYKCCEQPVTISNCTGTRSVKLVRVSPAVAVAAPSVIVSPLLVYRPHAPRCNHVKTC